MRRHTCMYVRWWCLRKKGKEYESLWEEETVIGQGLANSLICEFSKFFFIWPRPLFGTFSIPVEMWCHAVSLGIDTWEP